MSNHDFSWNSTNDIVNGLQVRLWIKIYTISFQIIYCCAVVHQVGATQEILNEQPQLSSWTFNESLKDKV